jgi:GAF domain-containing protein
VGEVDRTGPSAPPSPDSASARSNLKHRRESTPGVDRALLEQAIDELSVNAEASQAGEEHPARQNERFPAAPDETEARSEAEAAMGRHPDLLSVADVWLELASQSLDTVLRGVLLKVREVLAGDTATILLVSKDSRYLEVAAAVGGQEDVANQVRVPIGRGFAGRIAGEREPMVVPEVAEIEVENPFLRERVRSLIGVPLIVRDRVVGVLHVGSGKPGHFTSENLRLLRPVADRAAIAIENARLYESEQRARRDAERAADRAGRLQRVTTALSEALTPAEVAAVIIEQSIGALGAVAALITQVSPDQSTLRLLQASGYPDEVTASFASIPLEFHGPIASAVRDGQALFFESQAKLRSEFPALEEMFGVEGGGIAVVPLLLEGRARGALYLQFAHPRGFVEEDRSFLMALAHQCAQALERARLYEAERRAREQAEQAAGRAAVLQAVTAALSEALTPAEVAGVIVERGVIALGASAGSIGLKRDSDFEVVRTVGYKEELFEPWRTFPLDAPLPLAEAVRTGEAVFLGSKEQRDARYPHLAASMLRSDQAWAAIPLTVGRRTLGAMGLSFRDAREFSESDRGLMFALARQAAQAIERARLFEAEQIARRRAETAGEALAFLAEGSRSLGSSLEFEATVERVADVAVPFLADSCFIDLIDESGSLERVAASHADPSHAEFLRAPGPHRSEGKRSAHPVLDVLRTGRPKLMGDESKSVMVVPLVARGRTLGAITFVAPAGERVYGEEQLALATDLAGRAALAIDNARLFRDQRHIATALQRSLLPPNFPAIPGLEVAGRYRAAGEGIEVGGDFFDVFEAGDEEWAVVIGDVCGKGPEAAAVTGLARNTLRAAAMYEHRPSRLLRILNEAMLNHVQEDRFCTICYARLRPNPVGIRITLSTGGHPLPLVVREDGVAETIGFPGSLLGVFPDPELPDHVVDLAHGDIMVLFTDGLVEGRGGQDSLGEQGLAEVLSGSVGLDAETVAGRIEHAVLEQNGRGLRDDLAYIVLRVVPQ